MIRRAIPLALLLLLSLASCCPPGLASMWEPTPTVYYAPATPVVYAIPQLPPDAPAQREVTTVLVMGFDRRPSGGTSNTDAMMILRLDPIGQYIGVLSIPRDLYVQIPGHGKGRINTAYSWGERDGTGGLAQARQTVFTNLGLPVDHAILIDFRAFVTFIDAIGGIDVDVPYDISDPTYPDSGVGYDPFYLSAGPHHLDGATALKYVRSRATPGGDFSRSDRQRQVVLAVRERIVDLDLLPELIGQSPQLWSTLRDSIETDLTLGEMVDLAVVASGIPGQRIKTAAIDERSTDPWMTPGGASVLIPNQTAIEAVLADVLTAPPTPVPTPNAAE